MSDKLTSTIAANTFIEINKLCAGNWALEFSVDFARNFIKLRRWAMECFRSPEEATTGRNNAFTHDEYWVESLRNRFDDVKLSFKAVYFLSNQLTRR